MTHPSPTARFLAYLRPYRWTLALSTLVGVLKYNLPIIFPWLLKDVIDNLLSGRPSALGLSLDQLMLAAGALFCVSAWICYLRTLIADRLSHRMILDVRADLFRHLQRLPLDYFHGTQTGTIASRLVTDVALAQNFVGLLGTNIFMDVTSLVAVTVMMLRLNARLALLALCTLPLFVLLQRYHGARMRTNARECREKMASLEGALHESIAGIAEVKSFTYEPQQEKRFVQFCRAHYSSATRGIRIYGISLGTTAVLTRLPQVLVLWAGGHMVLRGQLTVGGLMAFYAYLELVYRPLERLGELNIQVANARAAIQRIGEFLELAPEQSSSAKLAPLAVGEGRIDFRGVAFSYRADRPVFRDLDLSIAAGERVALVGESGAGKSTLVKLLIRFHEPQAGTISFDGQEVHSVELRSLRSQIAFVHQDLVLFSGSIEENVRVGHPEATDAEVAEALERANARAFVAALPDGARTAVGERGVRLSAGQRQRIAIARAFLKNAPVLVLDESTSNLDPIAEAQVYDALERLMVGRTTLIIAHRLSTILRADRIVVLERGAIAQIGTHRQLIAEGTGPYARLYGGGPEARPLPVSVAMEGA